MLEMFTTDEEREACAGYVCISSSLKLVSPDPTGADQQVKADGSVVPHVAIVCGSWSLHEIKLDTWAKYPFTHMKFFDGYLFCKPLFP